MRYGLVGEKLGHSFSKEIHEQLADYSDSAERIKEVTYSKAGALVETEAYQQAIDIYQMLGDYKDSSTLYLSTALDYATLLVDKEDYTNAGKWLSMLSSYDAYDEHTDALYVSIMENHYANGRYDEALLAYQKTKGYDTNSDKYKDMTYNYALKLLVNRNYSAAKTNFKKVSGYLDADQKVIESDYQLGQNELVKKNYTAAVAAFERVKDYKDSKDRINEAKYLYVKANKTRTNNTTYSYLKDLKAAKYKDSADIFKELYAWKAEIIAVNSDPDDEKTNKTTISVYDPVYFHIKITGGEPGAEVTLTRKAVYPDGETYTNKWDWAAQDGTITWVGWSTGVYTNPEYGTRGTLKLQIYDESGNKIGEGSVRLTS